MISVFNFDKEKKFTETFQQAELKWQNREYSLQDILTGKEMGKISKGQTTFTIDVENKDAVMLKLVPVN